MTQVACIFANDGMGIEYTAVSAVAAGDVIVLGNVPMIAPHAIEAGATGILYYDRTWKVPKTSDVFTQGDAVYWNAAGDPVGGTAGTGACDGATGDLMGWAAKDAATGDEYCWVTLTAAKRTATLAGSVEADDITGTDSSLGISGIAGAGGGAGGIVAVAGGAGHTNGAGGAITATGGAGAGTGAGGAVTATGGASGTGATGNGGATSIIGGAALSTNGSGGAVAATGGVATGTGTGGAVTITGGASAGASGTAGSVVLNAGAAAGGTAGKVTLCASAGTLEVGGATEAAAIKAIKVSGTIAVAVPTIADAEIDEVAVDVSGMTFAAAVGDLVVAIPLEALPTSAILCGAYVSATDTVTVSFGAKEGGAGVTGANKNFKFVFIDLT